MNEQLPDSYLKYLENQSEDVKVEDQILNHQIDPTSSLLRIVAIIILFVSSIVLIFGWSSARNNPFSVLANNIPLEILPVARNSEVLLKDSLASGVNGNEVSGNINLNMKLENRLNLEDKIEIKLNGEYDLITYKDEDTLFDIKLGGIFNFGKYNKLYSFANYDFHYLQKKMGDAYYLNIDIPENLKTLILEESNVEGKELFGKDIEINKDDSIFNALIFDGNLKWQTKINYSNLVTTLNSIELSELSKKLLSELENFLRTKAVKRIGRENDAYNRQSIKYEISSIELNEKSRKNNFVKNIFSMIYQNSGNWIPKVCENKGFSEAETKCVDELSSLFSSINVGKFYQLQNVVSNIEIENFYIFIDPVRGDINKVDFKLKLPENFLKDGSDNIIGDYSIIVFSLDLIGNFETNSREVQVNKSIYGFSDLLNILDK